MDLVKEGFDPEAVKDRVWYRDPDTGKYELLNEDTFRKIGKGGVRF